MLKNLCYSNYRLMDNNYPLIIFILIEMYNLKNYVK